MKQKGSINILIILAAVIVFIIFGYTFLVSPHKVAGSPIEPFKEGEYFLSEKITYIFRDPEIGDRVIFLPVPDSAEYLGIIKATTQDEYFKKYEIVSGSRRTDPWVISKEKITGRIYYPFVSKQKIFQVIDSLANPAVNPYPDGSLSTYVSKDGKISFQYPYEIRIEEKQINDFSFLTLTLDQASVGIAPKGKYIDNPCTTDKSADVTFSHYAIEIGGEKAEGKLTTFNGTRTLTCYPITVKGYDFFFEYPYPDSPIKENFSKILSTFKFTD